ncbi:alpha,alpha-trehalase TreF [Sphingomonas aracearum]|uniref:Alpha,alpha-trehalase TreF n=1 Tax=Sphingomonas aracearum TaxID=2283317 RepID=A0A369VTJ8_9SPHN|nr:alpha,alpha-trehalase TreF [Sphingomonas aracearum]RDE05169.1 alpha,alpha-trehalase TreF [Sphingomonas aracearum]
MWRWTAAVAWPGLLAADLPPRELPPSERFPGLFAAVQERALFPDSKTFADAVPRGPAARILAEWRGRSWSDQGLRAFVLANFDVPQSVSAPPPELRRLPLPQHIAALWPQLTRRVTEVPDGGTALPLPKPFVVPGGRFRELYYWDSYFTMLGLRRDGRQDMVEAMIDDFASLIDRYGRIPNGTRSYYLSRSQPPVFYLMVQLSSDRTALKRRNDGLRAEHRFWMAGEAGMPVGGASRRVVRLPDGAVLNRYWDDRPAPRDESWREDVALARATPQRAAPELWRDLRAAAESGWDFSSRWLGDGRTLGTIRTTRFLPVDLNSLMFGMEQAIAANCRTLADDPCVREFRARAAARQRAIGRYLWSPAGFYADYDIDARQPSAARTAAMAFPLFVGAADPARAKATAAAMKPLIGTGGLATTMERTGQQWDAPNGWAPLQWVAVEGLGRYRMAKPAARIATAWLSTVSREYCASGRLLEKYDVVERRAGGGGEYATQDGFGWTNGVARSFMDRWPGAVQRCAAPDRTALVSSRRGAPFPTGRPFR